LIEFYSLLSELLFARSSFAIRRGELQPFAPAPAGLNRELQALGLIQAANVYQLSIELAKLRPDRGGGWGGITSRH
jgi:hypothetical protein